MKKISKLRGMQDLDPTETRKIDFIEKSFDEIVNSYGYQEVRFPILENTELFKRSVGNESDIVNKADLASFNILALRPMVLVILQ